eukprot:g13400.t1
MAAATAEAHFGVRLTAFQLEPEIQHDAGEFYTQYNAATDAEKEEVRSIIARCPQASTLFYTLDKVGQTRGRVYELLAAGGEQATAVTERVEAAAMHLLWVLQEWKANGRQLFRPYTRLTLAQIRDVCTHEQNPVPQQNASKPAAFAYWLTVAQQQPSQWVAPPIPLVEGRILIQGQGEPAPTLTSALQRGAHRKQAERRQVDYK